MDNLFTGLGTTFSTPFIDSGMPIRRKAHIGQPFEVRYPEKIDIPTLNFHMRKVLNWGLSDFFVVGDVAAEPSALDFEEHLKVIALAIEVAAKRLPVLAATGANSTAEAIELTYRAKLLGADGALIVVPYFNRPPERGIIQHFRCIRQEVNGMPIILYDNPERAGIGLSAEAILLLAKEETIQGVKLASGDPDQAKRIIACKPKNFTVLVGDDHLAYPYMNFGANGVISVIANFLPDKMSDLVRHLSHKVLSGTDKLNKSLDPLMRSMLLDTNPIPLKTALALIWPAKHRECFRLPLCPIGLDHRKTIEKTLRTYGLLG